jgi:RimJ/RimL family protein N-acetyltransferase
MTAAELEPHEPVVLRRARPDDCEAIWRWNFAPDVRARSKTGTVPAFIDHARWFARRLAEDDAPIWVVEEHGQGIGVIRLDPPEHGRARISISLAALVRGRGIGRAAVAAVCHNWRRPIAAEILVDNAASRTCFEACGFRAIAICDGLVTYHWDPEPR